MIATMRYLWRHAAIYGGMYGGITHARPAGYAQDPICHALDAPCQSTSTAATKSAQDMLRAHARAAGWCGGSGTKGVWLMSESGRGMGMCKQRAINGWCEPRRCLAMKHRLL